MDLIILKWVMSVSIAWKLCSEYVVVFIGTLSSNWNQEKKRPEKFVKCWNINGYIYLVIHSPGNYHGWCRYLTIPTPKIHKIHTNCDHPDSKHSAIQFREGQATHRNHNLSVSTMATNRPHRIDELINHWVVFHPAQFRWTRIRNILTRTLVKDVKHNFQLTKYKIAY